MKLLTFSFIDWCSRETRIWVDFLLSDILLKYFLLACHSSARTIYIAIVLLTWPIFLYKSSIIRTTDYQLTKMKSFFQQIKETVVNMVFLSSFGKYIHCWKVLKKLFYSRWIVEILISQIEQFASDMFLSSKVWFSDYTFCFHWGCEIFLWVFFCLLEFSENIPVKTCLSARHVCESILSDSYSINKRIFYIESLLMSRAITWLHAGIDSLESHHWLHRKWNSTAENLPCRLLLMKKAILVFFWLKRKNAREKDNLILSNISFSMLTTGIVSVIDQHTEQ